MQTKRINRASAEQVFVVALNNTSYVMSTGHAVIYDYLTNTTATSKFCNGNGYAVTFCKTVATSHVNPGLFAGIVAGRDIQGGDYGSVQCYGDALVRISGNTAGAPYWPTGFQGAWDDTTLSTVILRPLGLYGVTTGAYTNAGYLGLLSLVTSITTQAVLDVRPYWNAPYCVPAGVLMESVGTTSATATYTSSGMCKAFIRCM